MSDPRQNLPDPDSFTRQPGNMGSAGANPDDGAVSPDQALAEARAAKEAAEQRAANDRAAAEAAARDRDAAQAAAAAANAGAFDARAQAVDTAIQAHTNAVNQAKQDIANAQANGDHLAVADAMERMADAKAELKILGGQKQWLAEQKQRGPQPGQRQQQQQPQGHTVTTPGGQMAGVGDAAKNWMDAHPRFYNDGDYYNAAINAHGMITRDGMQEGTPAYFRALDAAMEKFERFEAFDRGDGQQQQQNGGNQMSNPDPYAAQRVSGGQRQQGRPAASSVGAPPSRGQAPSYQQNSNGQVDPLAIARHIGPNVTIDDLKTFARSNGYVRGRQDASRLGPDGKPAVYESDEAAFQSYLREHQNIIDLERRGEDTGLRVDSVYR